MTLFGQHIPVLWQTVVLLALSNVFMTLASYTGRITCRISKCPSFLREKTLGKCFIHLP